MASLKLPVIIIGLAIASCRDNKNVQNGATANNAAATQFDSFRSEFPILTLPIKISGCKMDDKGFSEVFPEKYPAYVEYREGALGTFKTNGNFIAMITLGEADCYVPVLTTYDMQGRKIDEKVICSEQCGSDVGYSCKDCSIVRADYTIYFADSITTFESDSLGNQVPGTTQHYVEYTEGKLLPSGKIELSEKKKEYLKE